MSRKSIPGACTYCGAAIPRKGEGRQKEHAIPDSFFPPIVRAPELGLQLVTVPSCPKCNADFQDDDVHFRNVLCPVNHDSEAAKQLQQATLNSFKPDQRDGHRRFADFLKATKIVQTEQGPRHAVYPGEDSRVLRIVRKIIRGMSRKVELPWPVADYRVLAVWCPFELPQQCSPDFRMVHNVEDVVNVRCFPVGNGFIHSYWSITFLDRAVFMGAVAAKDKPFQPELMGVPMDQWDGPS